MRAFAAGVALVLLVFLYFLLFVILPALAGDPAVAVFLPPFAVFIAVFVLFLVGATVWRGSVRNPWL